MSEKRCIVKSEKIGRFHNIFVQTDKIEYLLTGDFDNDSEMMKEIVDKLNEQQATIGQLQDLCGKSDSENAKLRIENKKLQEEIRLLKPTNIEQYEQIVQLQEEINNNKLADSLADEIKKNGVLNEELNQLRIENMRLKKKGG